MSDNIFMENWPNRRLLDLLKLDIPIIQAPMAGSDSVPLARSVSSTGALGSLACALLTPDGVREAARAIREGMSRPFNLNFFCHTMEVPDLAAKERWEETRRHDTHSPSPSLMQCNSYAVTALLPSRSAESGRHFARKSRTSMIGNGQGKTEISLDLAE